MKIGDNIRYLNAQGGGVVKAFKGKDTVLVEDQDGFDVPVLIKECIVIASASEPQVRQTVKALDDQIHPELKNDTELEIYETKEGELINVCLAYLPIDIKSLSTSGYEGYLINDSNYYLTFNYMNRTENGWVSRFTGTVEPNTKVFIEEFEKEDLNSLERICIQFFVYKKNKSFTLKNTCSVELRLDPVKFYKLHSFKENDYFEDTALIYQVMKNDLPEKEIIIYAENLEQAINEKKQSIRPRIESAKKSKNNKLLLEVDLHIEALVDTKAGLSPTDILEFQLVKFRETMDQYRGNKGQKIVFIHGKGNGVLKKSILDEIKAKYKNAISQDASFQEYGYGATMVTIK